MLKPGDTDATTGGAVTPLQNQLLVWDPNILPTFGADGDYGAETANAVIAFQTATGLSPVDGIAGPETRSALDLVERLAADPGDYPPELWFGEVAAADDGAWIGPAALPSGPAVAGLGILPPAAAGYKSATGTVLGGLGLVGTVAGGRGGPAVAGLGLVGTVHATKSATGTAVAGLGVAGRVDQFVAELAAVGAVATPTGRPAAVATRR